MTSRSLNSPLSNYKHIYGDRGITWNWLDAKYKCDRTYHDTMKVYMQETAKVGVKTFISVILPITFNICKGTVVVDMVDERLVPLKSCYMLDTPKTGLRTLVYNSSEEVVEIKEGELLCILRHV